MTNGEITSEIVNILKTNNKDNRLSRRFILKVLKDASAFLISQKWGDRSILSETSLYSYIPCFEFDKIETKDCPSLEFRLCKTLMKSKKPLPKLIFSRLGSSVKDIVSLDGDFLFAYVDEQQYRRNKKRQHKLKNEVYIYLGVDNHLYIPDQEIYSVDLTVLTTEPEEVDECSACKDKDNCLNAWNEIFVVPLKLIEAVKDLAMSRLGITRQIQSDPNLNGSENA